MIGDSSPHPPHFTTERIHWHDELDRLVDMGIKVLELGIGDTCAHRMC